MLFSALLLFSLFIVWIVSAFFTMYSSAKNYYNTLNLYFRTHAIYYNNRAKIKCASKSITALTNYVYLQLQPASQENSSYCHIHLSWLLFSSATRWTTNASPFTTAWLGLCRFSSKGGKHRRICNLPCRSSASRDLSHFWSPIDGRPETYYCSVRRQSKALEHFSFWISNLIK
jgi:hypothetical protein